MESYNTLGVASSAFVNFIGAPMPRFAANLTLMYQEHAFPDRFAAARADGFDAVECLFPYTLKAQVCLTRLQDHGLQQVLFNAPPGDWEAGERGLAALPGREADFRHGIIEQALPYAQTLRGPRLHVLAGLLPPNSDPYRGRSRYLDNLAWAASMAAPLGIDILIEPINPRDMPGYYLTRQDEAHDLVTEVGMANLGVLMDLYHCQIVEGDLARHIETFLPNGRVRHFQIAGVPDRHEPDNGEINYPYLFDLIDRLGFRGTIGCEYRPQAGTSQGLGWLKKLPSHRA